jgi:Formate--tetrahydrofolate ligase
MASADWSGFRRLVVGGVSIMTMPVAKSIYHASEVVADTNVRKKIEKFQEDGFGHLPICIAKTQYSFSTDPNRRGACRWRTPWRCASLRTALRSSRVSVLRNPRGACPKAWGLETL